MFNKKGISAIVATVLIILITVAAVTIVWVAVIPMIKTNLEMGTACLDADVIIDSSSGYTCYDAEKKILAVQVKKGPNEVDIAEVELLLASGGTSSKVSMPFDLGTNDGKVIYLPVDEDVDEVSLAPVIQIGNSEKTCDVTTRVSLKSCSLGEEVFQLLSGDRSCLGLYNSGYRGEGTYTIDPDGKNGIVPFEVYCDMTTDGGGWTLVGKYNRDSSENWVLPSGTGNGWGRSQINIGDMRDITTFTGDWASIDARDLIENGARYILNVGDDDGSMEWDLISILNIPDDIRESPENIWDSNYDSNKDANCHGVHTEDRIFTYDENLNNIGETQWGCNLAAKGGILDTDVSFWTTCSREGATFSNAGNLGDTTASDTVYWCFSGNDGTSCVYGCCTAANIGTGCSLSTNPTYRYNLMFMR